MVEFGVKKQSIFKQPIDNPIEEQVNTQRPSINTNIGNVSDITTWLEQKINGIPNTSSELDTTWWFNINTEPKKELGKYFKEISLEKENKIRYLLKQKYPNETWQQRFDRAKRIVEWYNLQKQNSLLKQIEWLYNSWEISQQNYNKLKQDILKPKEIMYAWPAITKEQDKINMQNMLQKNISATENKEKPWLLGKLWESIASFWELITPFEITEEEIQKATEAPEWFTDAFWQVLQQAGIAWQAIINLPWDAVEAIWELTKLADDPVEVLNTVWTLAEWLVDKSQWKRTRKSMMLDTIAENVWETITDPNKLISTIANNPFDTIAVLNPKTWISAAKKAAGIVTKPVVKAAEKVTWLITKEIPSSILGKLTGTWKESIKEAFKKWWTKTYAKALAGEIDDDDILRAAQEWLSTIKEQRNIIYWKDYNKVLKNKTKIDIWDIDDEILNELKKSKIDIIDTDKWPKLDFSKSTVTQPKSQAAIQDMFDDILWWEDVTPEWLDILKQRIQDRWIGTTETGKSDRLSTIFSNKIKDKIVAEVPEYKQMAENYKKISNTLKDISKTLSLWNEKSKMTAITRLKQSLKDNIAFRKEAVDLLEEAANIDIKSALAWNALNSWMPKWLMGSFSWAWIALWAYLTNPSLVAWLVASSPKIIWSLARAVWVSKNILNKWLNNLNTIYTKLWDTITSKLPVSESFNIWLRWVWVKELTDKDLNTNN